MGNLGFVVLMVSFEREGRQAGENRVERGQKQQPGERGREPAQRCPLDLTAFRRLGFGGLVLFLNICHPVSGTGMCRHSYCDELLSWAGVQSAWRRDFSLTMTHVAFF